RRFARSALGVRCVLASLFRHYELSRNAAGELAACATTLLHASWHFPLYRLNAHRKRIFDSVMKLDLFRDTTFELVNSYALILQAWAFFPNHYHLVVSFENTR